MLWDSATGPGTPGKEGERHSGEREGGGGSEERRGGRRRETEEVGAYEEGTEEGRERGERGEREREGREGEAREVVGDGCEAEGGKDSMQVRSGGGRGQRGGRKGGEGEGMDTAGVGGVGEVSGGSTREASGEGETQGTRLTQESARGRVGGEALGLEVREGKSLMSGGGGGGECIDGEGTVEVVVKKSSRCEMSWMLLSCNLYSSSALPLFLLCSILATPAQVLALLCLIPPQSLIPPAREATREAICARCTVGLLRRKGGRRSTRGIAHSRHERCHMSSKL
jgi:hypothetical protein